MRSSLWGTHYSCNESNVSSSVSTYPLYYVTVQLVTETELHILKPLEKNTVANMAVVAIVEL